MKAQRFMRKNAGSTLVLTVAITVGIVIALIFFFLNYARILGGFSQQKTATEAAALAAASDISKIVVASTNMGYVSISDVAPAGQETVAPDTYGLPVYGINTLIGTARLDMIVGENLNDQTMQALAENDVLNIVNDALPTLISSLQDAIKQAPQKQYFDAFGNQVEVYQDALNAYKQNSIQMTGSAQLVQGSFQLQLGYVTKVAPTNIPVPQPYNPGSPGSGLANANDAVPAASEMTGTLTIGNTTTQIPVYLSYTSVPAGTAPYQNSYMLAGIGSNVTLVDYRSFVPVPSQKYPVLASPVTFTQTMLPTIVAAEANEVQKTPQDPNPAPVHTLACAQPGNTLDPRPAPGSFSVNLPDGPVPELPFLGVLFSPYIQLYPYTDYASTNPPAGTLTALNGDYPSPWNQATLGNNLPDGQSPWPKLPGVTGQPSIGAIMRCGIYDFVRRGGVLARLDQLSTTTPNTFLTANLATATTPKDWITMALGGIQGAVPINVTALSLGGSDPHSGITIPAHTQIPSGVLYAFSWNSQGYIIAKPPQTITPLPYSMISQNQLYGEQTNAIPQSTVPLLEWYLQPSNPPIQINGVQLTSATIVEALPQWDIYVRDQVRYPGPDSATNSNGGQHGGEPLPNSFVSYRVPQTPRKNDIKLTLAFNERHGTAKGLSQGAGGTGAQGLGGGGGGNGPGAYPILAIQNDFDVGGSDTTGGINSTDYVGYTYSPAPWPYQGQAPWNYPQAKSLARPTYQVNGEAVEIRFRREVSAAGNNVSKYEEEVLEGISSAGVPIYETVTETIATPYGSIGYFAEEQ